MKFYVYKVTNILNGKIYIGKTRNVKTRWLAHVRAAKYKRKNDYGYFHRAINKYKKENFKVEELESYETEELAFDGEKKYIKLLDARNKKIGYNLTDGGNGPSGIKCTEEAKINLRKKHKARFASKTKEELMEHGARTNKFNFEQCIEVQKLYLTKEYTITRLTEKFKTDNKAIKRIIDGSYAILKGYSLLSKKDINDVKLHIASLAGKNNTVYKNGIKINKLCLDDYINIIDECLNTYDTSIHKTLKSVADKYKITEPLIKRIFIKMSIDIKEYLK